MARHSTLGTLAALAAVLWIASPRALAQPIGGDNFRTTTTGSAVATGAQAIAIGSGTASNNQAIAIGFNANATSQSANAIGDNASATAANGIALGSYAKASGQQSTAIGYYASASTLGSIALGYSANSAAIYATAIGSSALAAANYDNAIGYYASATGASSNAIGDHASASAANATALGSYAVASGGQSTALGLMSTAAGADAIAIGYNAFSLNAAIDSMAIGTSATVTARSSIAIGLRANVTGANSNAIGYGALASAGNANAVGNFASALGGNSTAIGTSATAAANGAIVIGINTGASGISSVAIGSYATATILGNVSLGANSIDRAAVPFITDTVAGKAVTYVGTANGGVISIGNDTTTRQLINVAAGQVNANSTDAINGSQLYVTNTTLAALTSTLSNITSGSLRLYDYAFTTSPTAAYVNPAATAAGALVGGTALGNYSLAMGYQSSATGNYSTAIGYQANASGPYAISLGFSTTASGQNAIAIGDENSATALHAVVIGFRSSATASNAIAIGTSATASAASSIAMGTSATTAFNNSVAFGSYSVADRNAGVGGSGFAAFSIGQTGATRQIINVARGTELTDAVNVSQLQQAVTLINGGTINNTTGDITGGDTLNINTGTTIINAINNLYTSASAFAADALLWNTASNAFVATHGGTNNKITGVAPGAINSTSVDAINGSQLYGTATSIVNILGTGTVNPNGTITSSTFIGGGTTINQALTNIYNSATNGLPWVSSSNAFVAVHNGTNNKITGVLAGAVNSTSVDAINGSQLYGTATSIVNILGTGTVNPNGIITSSTFVTSATTINQALTNIYNSSTALSADALLWSSTLGAFNASHSGTAQRITNLAKGNVSGTSTDAINGAQLYGTATSIVNILGTGTVNGDGTITGGTFVTGGTTINQALTNIYNSNTANTTNITNLTSGSAGVLRYNGANGDLTIGAQFTGTVLNISSGTGATATPRLLTGVAKGAVSGTSVDAINGSQLYGLAGSITNALGTGTVNPDGTIGGTTFVTGGTTVNQALSNIYVTATTIAGNGLQWNNTLQSGTGAYDASRNGAPAKISNVAAAALNAVSTDAVNGSQLYDTNQRVTNLEVTVANLATGNNPHFTTGNDDTTILATATGNNVLAAGMGATATGDNTTAVGARSQASANGATALGTNSQAQAINSTAIGANSSVLAGATNSVAIGAGSQATEPNTVSFGTPGNERRLTNIAPGINRTDAVNYGQLLDFAGTVNDQFNNVYNSMNKLGDRINSVGAMAAAMNQAQLRLSPQENRQEMALGIGAYRDHGAFALSYGYTSRRGDRGIQAGFSMSDKAEVMGGAGVVFGW